MMIRQKLSISSTLIGHRSELVHIEDRLFTILHNPRTQLFEDDWAAIFEPNKWCDEDTDDDGKHYMEIPGAGADGSYSLNGIGNSTAESGPTWFEYTIYDSTECSTTCDTTTLNAANRQSAKFRVALNLKYKDTTPKDENLVYVQVFVTTEPSTPFNVITTVTV